MATQTQNAKTILDALADAAGKAPRTVAQLTRIVETITKTRDSGLTNEQKAQNFNQKIYRALRRELVANAEWYAQQDYQDDIDNAGDTAAGDL